MSAESRDAWTRPDRCVQVLTLGGFIFDVSIEQFQMLLDEMAAMGAPSRLLMFEDIYGASCTVRCDAVVGGRETSPEVEDHYSASHDGDDQSWSGDW